MTRAILPVLSVCLMGSFLISPVSAQEKRITMPEQTVQGTQESPQVAIIDGTVKGGIRTIKLQRSFKKEIMAPVDKDAFERTVNLRMRTSK